MSRVFVFGSLNMDLAIQSERMPEKGETLAGHNFRTCPGGKGANQAIACAKLGGEVKMLGAVGSDPFGKEMIDALKKYNVETKNIHVLQGKSSGIAEIILIKGDNRIILDLGANLLLTKDQVNNFLRDAKENDIFLTQSENDIKLIGYALEQAKNKKMITVVNPAPANKEILKYASFIDIFVPNEIELKILSGSDDIECSFKKLNVKNLLVTLGDKGYSLVSKEGCFKGTAPKVKVVDTTGAGDCFIGALCYQLSMNLKLNKKAADFACKAASFSVTKTGSSSSSPTIDDLR